MKIGITHKLFLAILTASILAVAGLVITMQWQVNRGFLKFIDSIEQPGISRLAAKLESRYAAEKSWSFLTRNPSLWRSVVSESMHMPHHEGMPPGPPDGFPLDPPSGPLHDGPRPGSLPPHMARQFDQRLFLLNTNKQVIISQASVPADNIATPIRHNNQIVGYLGILPRTIVSDPFQQRFLRDQKKSFLIVTCLSVLLAAGLSMLLAARLIKPVKALAKATHCLAAGDHNVRVPVASNDELGHLAEDFNALAITLEKNDRARRQWVADISHELRTPLAILRGEIEAFQDGIRQPSQEAVASLHSEVLRLGRLVEDLFQLSLSDLCDMTYSKTNLDCSTILLDAIDSYDTEFNTRNITLNTEILPDSSKYVFADGERLYQLFTNLLENSLKYTNSRGKLVVRLEYQRQEVVIHFEDSAPGVPPESIGLLFERLFRVETSRNRSLGGAGLGLSICKNIVEAHNGTIEAHPSSLDGLCIKVTLPLSGRMI